MIQERLLGWLAARALWSTRSFPGRWRVARWAMSRPGCYRKASPRPVRKPDFEFLVAPDASLDVYLNGISDGSAIERTIRRFVTPGMHVLDVGANIGWTARLMSARVGAQGSVQAFEPMPTALHNLRANAAAAPHGNIQVHAMAASDACGEIDIFVSATEDTALATIRPPEGGEKAHRSRVRTVTLDSLLDTLKPIGFAKLDVEGAEYKVLLGMRALLARDRPVLAIELSDAWLRRLGSSGDALLQLLVAQGYEVFEVQPDGLAPLAAAPAHQIDIVAVPRRADAAA